VTASPARPGQWLGEALKPVKAPIPWTRGMYVALAVAVPFAGGILAGHVTDGLLASLGSLPAATADRGGPHRVRTLRIGASALSVVVGLVVGMAIFGRGWLVIPVVAIGAALSSLLSGLGAVGSICGLNGLTYLVVAAGDPLPHPIWRTAVLALAGGAWALLLAVPAWIKSPLQPERRAVATVYRRVADLLWAAGTGRAIGARQALMSALTDAQASLAAYRANAGGSERSTRGLLVALAGANPLIEVALARLRSGKAAPVEAIRAVTVLADAIERRRLLPSEAIAVSLPPGALRDALRRARRAVNGQDEDLTTTGWVPVLDPWWRRWRTTGWPKLRPGKSGWIAMVRLVACMVAAETVSQYGLHGRSYWVPLTTAVVLKPDFGSVFARGVQRAVGTSVGVALGAVLLTVTPATDWLLVAFAVLAFLLPVGVLRNYGIFVTMLTPLVLMQITIVTHDLHPLVVDRWVDTLTGCAIVIVGGYLLWPETWRPRLATRVDAAARAVAAYMRAALGDEGADRATVGSRQRRAYASLSDLRLAQQRSFAEPAPAGTQARLLWPVTVALERAVDEVAALTVRCRQLGERPSPDGVRQLAAAMEQLGLRAIGGRVPERIPLPKDLQLAGLADEVRTAGRALDQLNRRRSRRRSQRIRRRLRQGRAATATVVSLGRRIHLRRLAHPRRAAAAAGVKPSAGGSDGPASKKRGQPTRATAPAER
jgi:uncharacterized membrane protein YccC